MDKKKFFKEYGDIAIFSFVAVILFGFPLFYELREFKRTKEFDAIMLAPEPYYLTERNMPIVLYDKNKEPISQLIDSTTNYVYPITARIVYVVWDSTEKLKF